MDRDKQTLNAVTLIDHPAQLWIGSESALATQAERYLQHRWCATNGCGICTICTSITRRQFHNLLWIEPEKGYTLDRIDQILTTLQFTLEAHQSFFFILARADTLSIACSNRLLKAIEEPPRGYHFILLAQQIDAILPTIRSRCTVQLANTTGLSSTYQTLIDFLTRTKTPNVLDFLQMLDTTPISEYHSSGLLDQLFTHWSEIYKKALLKGNATSMTRAKKIVLHLKKSIEQPPMPGSTKLFWKNIFLQIYE